MRAHGAVFRLGLHHLLVGSMTDICQHLMLSCVARFVLVHTHIVVIQLLVVTHVVCDECMSSIVVEECSKNAICIANC